VSMGLLRSMGIVLRTQKMAYIRSHNENWFGTF
jgi:hypothetical protein